MDETAMLSSLENIEFYTAISAVCLCLGMGLVVWRLILLSKNQRKLF